MKYVKGDLLADFSNKRIFVYDGGKIEPKIFIKLRMLTPGEAGIFKQKFAGKKSVSFEEFSLKMPHFNKKKFQHVTYGHIALEEYQYLFFRSMHDDVFRWATTLEDKLDILIHRYETNKIKTHNGLAKEQDLKKSILSEVDRLLSNFLPETLNDNHTK